MESRTSSSPRLRTLEDRQKVEASIDTRSPTLLSSALGLMSIYISQSTLGGGGWKGGGGKRVLC